MGIEEQSGEARLKNKSLKSGSAKKKSAVPQEQAENIESPVKQTVRKKPGRSKRLVDATTTVELENQTVEGTLKISDIPREKKKTGKKADLSTGQGKVERVKVQVIEVKSGDEEDLLDGENSESLSMDPFRFGDPLNTITRTSRMESIREQELPLRAVKIRNVDGRVRDLVAEIIPNKVIVQGIVDEQLFFIGSDGVVHHQGDEINFSAFLDIAGALPGMNAQVSAEIETIIPELASDGKMVVKKIIVEIFVKLTETVQVNLLSGAGPLVLLKQVIGENTAQTMLETDLILRTPALKIEEIIGKIQNLELEVIKDKVIIQGILHKQVFLVGTDNLGRHQGEDAPFSLFVDLPGVLPGMDVQVDPKIEAIFFELVDPTLVREKAILEFFVKVTENFRQNVTVGDGPLCKVAEYVGENSVQELSETQITLPMAAVKVREIIARVRNVSSHGINDKIIVQGTIHKQIFYVGVDNIERHQAEDVPFAVFLDIPGTIKGDAIQVNPIIEAIFFELVSPTQLRQKVIVAVHGNVTRETQLNLVLGVGPLFKVDQVIGENTKQILVVRQEEIVVPNPPPNPPVIPITIRETPIVFPVMVNGTQQIILRNQSSLPVAAIKIKDVQGEIVDLNSRIIDEKVLVEGILSPILTFVDPDNIVRSEIAQAPFSILVDVPGIVPSQTLEVTVEIENISAELGTTGETYTQLAVIKAIVSGALPNGETITVVTDVAGDGVTAKNQERVRELVLLSDGQRELQEFDVVTDVSGPAISGTVKRVLPLIVVGKDLTQTIPVEVVTKVMLA